MHRIVRAALIVAVIAGVLTPLRPAGAAPRQWVGSWGTAVAPQALDGWRTTATFGGPDVNHQTIRMVMRPAMGGAAVRIRLSNEAGAHPVEIAKMTIGVLAGRGIKAGTMRDLRVADRPGLVLAPGHTAVTDGVHLVVAPGQDLAVSLHVLRAKGPFSGHEEYKRVTWSSVPGTGDWTHDESGAGLQWASTSLFWVDRLDVLTDKRPVIVAIGDSITDGHGALPEQHQDWPSRLADRLHGSAAVINTGINGNTLTRTGCGACGKAIVDRLERDVLSVPGVTHVIVFAGTNDLTQNVSAGRITNGMADIARRARARGITVIGATITPRDDQAFGWDPARYASVRHQVNDWVLRSRNFDAVLDFDRVVRDPNSPEFLSLQYDSGDRLHPNAAGMTALANAVDLRMFSPR